LTLIVKIRFSHFGEDGLAWSAAQAPSLRDAVRRAPANEADRAMRHSPDKTARSLMAAPLMLAALSACAPTSAPEDARAAVAPARAQTQETSACQPDPALFTPPAAPDCVFGRRDLKTLDPDQWARLKIEYE